MDPSVRHQELLPTSEDGQSTEQPRRSWWHAPLVLVLTLAVVGAASTWHVKAHPPSVGVDQQLSLYSRAPDAPGAQFVEVPMSDPEAESSLQMSVQMLGLVSGDDQVWYDVRGHLVKVDNPIGRVSIGLPPGGCGHLEKPSISAVSRNPKCKLAVNAGYFNLTNGKCIGNLVSDGSVLHSVPLAESNVNFGIRQGKFVIGYFTPEELQGFEQLVSGCTWLVREGRNYVDVGWAEANSTIGTAGDAYMTQMTSRTGVGVDKEGKLIIIQTDGSHAIGHNKRGINMHQLADLFIEHGAVHAINLDGGGSSVMINEGIIINYPYDNLPPSCWVSGVYQCERPVSTLLCIHEDESGSMFVARATDRLWLFGGFCLGAACCAACLALTMWKKGVPLLSAKGKSHDSDSG